jgi:hypothetical protein
MYGERRAGPIGSQPHVGSDTEDPDGPFDPLTKRESNAPG